MSTEVVEQRQAFNIYTNEDRKTFAILYALTGNVKEIAKQTGWPDKTLYGWLKSNWFPDMYEEAKREHAELIEARLSTILEKATTQLIDRVENGNIVLTKSGIARLPIPAKELNQIIMESITKLRLMQNKPSKVTAEVKFDADKIAREFADIAERNRTRIVSEQ
jgi:hypothetical protein